MRRGAATDLMEQVGDALAAPRVASVADERPPCWWIEKGERTKKQVSQVRGAMTSEPRCDFPLWQCPRSHAPRGRGPGGKSHLFPWS